MLLQPVQCILRNGLCDFNDSLPSIALKARSTLREVSSGTHAGGGLFTPPGCSGPAGRVPLARTRWRHSLSLAGRVPLARTRWCHSLSLAGRVPLARTRWRHSASLAIGVPLAGKLWRHSLSFAGGTSCPARDPVMCRIEVRASCKDGSARRRAPADSLYTERRG